MHTVVEYDTSCTNTYWILELLINLLNNRQDAVYLLRYSV